MNKRSERLINRIYNSIFKKIFNNENINISSQKGKKHIIEKFIDKFANSEQFNNFAKKFAKKLLKTIPRDEQKEWKEDYNKSKSKTDFPTYKDFEISLFRKIIKNNFKMIKTIPKTIKRKYQTKYIDTLIDQVARGSIGRDTFKNELIKNGVRNAKTIARTETAKLRAFINEHKARDLGSVAYIWLANRDIRTRKSHRDMDGVVVLWKKGKQRPYLDKMWGNAGEFPNCRCSAKPIYDEFDLQSNNYRVYNYKKHKIVNMTKNQLETLLEKGEF